jgi:hypothetical protein
MHIQVATYHVILRLSVIIQAFNKLICRKVVNSEVSQGLLGKNELINVPG